jgi:predicted dehydrogenase
MTEPQNPLRVLIVGAGRRVRNNFLPALACLGSQFRVEALVSPTPVRRAALAAQWGVASWDSIADIELAGIDVVAISVPTSENAGVLRALLPHADRLRLVIDTPIAWTPREYAACAPLLDRFPRLTVAEDYMNFPSFALAREATGRGLIGEVKWLTLNNIGYFYHGLALIRSFAGFAKVRSSRPRDRRPSLLGSI